MIYRTLLGRSTSPDSHPSVTDYEVEVYVEYRWHPATAVEDASAEVLSAVDDEGRDVFLTMPEELRVMRGIESKHEQEAGAPS